MSSFKIKPLSMQPVLVVTTAADGTTTEQTIALGQAVDLEVTAGMSITVTEAPEIVAEASMEPVEPAAPPFHPPSPEYAKAFPTFPADQADTNEA